MKITLPILLLLGATLSAQDPEDIAGVDVHVIAVQRLDGANVPKLDTESVRRYAFDRQAPVSDPRQPDKTWGAAKGIEQLNVGRRPENRLVLDYKFHIRRRSRSTAGETLDLRGDVKAFTNFGRGQRTRFGRAYRYLLFIPWSKEPEKLEPWAPEAYANWLVEHLMDRGGVGCGAAMAMLHIPLVRLVDAPLLARFRDWLAELTPSGRHPQRNNGNVRSAFQMPPENLILGLGLATGDPDAIEEIRNHEHDWMLRAPLHLAFIQVGDPILKGEAGWLLVAPRDDPASIGLRERDLIVPYFQLAEAGKLEIPGTDDERNRRHAQLAAWVAESDSTAALVVIAIAGFAVFCVAFAARRVALKLAM